MGSLKDFFLSAGAGVAGSVVAFGGAHGYLNESLNQTNLPLMAAGGVTALLSYSMSKDFNWTTSAVSAGMGMAMMVFAAEQTGAIPREQWNAKNFQPYEEQIVPRRI